MCDIMSASLDQHGSTASTPMPRRHTTDCATGVREREDTDPLDHERPEENTLQRCSALSETFTVRFLSQLPQTLHTGVCFCLASMFRRIHEVSNHHFDDLANGARFKKRHCWGVRIWFDQPRKER